MSSIEIMALAVLGFLVLLGPKETIKAFRESSPKGCTLIIGLMLGILILTSILWDFPIEM